VRLPWGNRRVAEKGAEEPHDAVGVLHCLVGYRPDQIIGNTREIGGVIDGHPGASLPHL
jgi:hypothetical protein